MGGGRMGTQRRYIAFRNARMKSTANEALNGEAELRESTRFEAQTA